MVRAPRSDVDDLRPEIPQEAILPFGIADEDIIVGIERKLRHLILAAEGFA